MAGAVVAVGGATVAVGDGVLSPPPQAAASANKNTREASVGFTSLYVTVQAGTRPLCSRMRFFVDLPHVFGGEVGVDLSGGDVGVPQHLLDVT